MSFENIVTHNPSKYVMNHPNVIVANWVGESISQVGVNERRSKQSFKHEMTVKEK